MLSQTKADRTIIITGGNSGLGYQCAKAIAQSERGWQIVIASRNLYRVERAVRQLITETGYPHIQGLELDLASLQSVRHFVRQLAHLHIPPLKGLICNAGVQIVSGTTFTVDGFEATFGVNHLAHFLLVNLLLLQMVEGSRIVFVSSDTHDPTTQTGMPAPRYESPHQMAFPLEINKMENAGLIRKSRCDAIFQRKGYCWGKCSATANGQRRYATSKLCNLLCTYELARRLQRHQSTISVNAFNPGLMLDTQLARGYSTKQKLALLLNNFLPLLRQVLKFHNSKNMGKAMALTILNPDLDVVTGQYFDGFVRGAWALPKRGNSSLESHDKHKAVELWDASKVLVGLEESI
jgi:NAD(P)-dependent dehydrogenase (short-subunit alcohol dehydrogenase family)